MIQKYQNETKFCKYNSDDIEPNYEKLSFKQFVELQNIKSI